MDLEPIDHYLLDGKPAKAAVVAGLLAAKNLPPVAGPFLEGLRVLGPRTPDLALIALRLALAGHPHDDASVTRLRGVVDRVRAGDTAAREAYLRELA